MAAEERRVNTRADEAEDDGYSGDSEKEISRAEAYKLHVLKRWYAETKESPSCDAKVRMNHPQVYEGIHQFIKGLLA